MDPLSAHGEMKSITIMYKINSSFVSKPLGKQCRINTAILLSEMSTFFVRDELFVWVIFSYIINRLYKGEKHKTFVCQNYLLSCVWQLIYFINMNPDRKVLRSPPPPGPEEPESLDIEELRWVVSFFSERHKVIRKVNS